MANGWGIICTEPVSKEGIVEGCMPLALCGLKDVHQKYTGRGVTNRALALLYNHVHKSSMYPAASKISHIRTDRL